KMVSRQELFCGGDQESEASIKIAYKHSNHIGVLIDSNAHVCWCLVSKDCATAEVRLDIDTMRRNEIYQLLITPEFPARKSHTQTIVRNDDDVKHLPHKNLLVCRREVPARKIHDRSRMVRRLPQFPAPGSARS